MALTARAEIEPDGGTVIDPLHIPDGARERMRGLLDYDGLDECEGMWFPSCRLIHTFGMKFTIDLVYLTSRMEVCKVVSPLRPARLSACLAADSVIELGFGAAQRLGLRRGVKVRIIRSPDADRP